jgi:protein gp37
MGDTSISWTDKTWNPIRGCSRVSEGCRHCYAERVESSLARRYREGYRPGLVLVDGGRIDRG